MKQIQYRTRGTMTTMKGQKIQITSIVRTGTMKPNDVTLLLELLCTGFVMD